MLRDQNVMQTFSDEIKNAVIKAQNGYCKECFNTIHSIHHKLPNIKSNRKKYPLFIHSPFNAVGLCFKDHQNKSHQYIITQQEAQVYEEWLRGKVS